MAEGARGIRREDGVVHRGAEKDGQCRADEAAPVLGEPLAAEPGERRPHVARVGRAQLRAPRGGDDV